MSTPVPAAPAGPERGRRPLEGLRSATLARPALRRVALTRAVLTRSILAAAVLVAPVVLAALPSDGAAAQVTGGCSATIAGQDVGAARSARSAIEVGADDTITVSGSAPGPITGYEVYLSFGGIRFPAASGEVTDNDTSYTTEVNVADYAVYGVGLYRVEAETTGTPCSTWAYVKVTDRFPLFTVAGAIGGAMTAGGFLGMLRAAMRSGPKGVRA